jgi:hypothetical protein
MSAMIFIQNKYTYWYYGIISNAQLRNLPKNTYIEKHHIIPRSLGGTNEHTNLVKLTAREHFVCHLLLTKMVNGIARKSMCYAAWQMTLIKDRRRHKPTARMYEILKKKLSQSYKGIPKTEEQKKKQSAIMKGRTGTPHTAAHKKYMSALYTGKPKSYASFAGKQHTEETKKKQSACKQGKNNPMYGQKQTSEAKLKISIKQKGVPKPRYTCEYCGANIGGKSNYIRYHGANCGNK